MINYDFPRCYLISNSQQSVVKDMFGKELYNKSIVLRKVPNCTNANKKYHLIYYKQNTEIDWWLSYSQVPRLFELERSYNCV